MRHGNREMGEKGMDGRKVVEEMEIDNLKRECGKREGGEQ